MTDNTIHIVCSCDDNYVMPLGVMLTSLFENIDPSRKAVIYVLDGGISPNNHDKLLRSFKIGNSDIRFIKMGHIESLEHLVVNKYISVAAYYRLLIPSLLPESLHKIIYLDCDLIIQADIGRLWDIDLGNSHLLAAQNQDRNLCLFSSPASPIDYKKLGLSPTCKYFNSGVLVINLSQWRQDKISSKITDYLRENKTYEGFWDQDGLNVVLANKWGELDPRWNQQTPIFDFPNWKDHRSNDEIAYAELIQHPHIVHYCCTPKPWEWGCGHPLVKLFERYLSKTLWFWQWKFGMYRIKIALLLNKILGKPVFKTKS